MNFGKGASVMLLALTLGCGGRSTLDVFDTPPARGGGNTLDIGDGMAATVADAGADVALDTSLADARPDVLGTCSTPDAGTYCPSDRIFSLPLTGDPAACGLTTASACMTLCPYGTADCSLERDAGVVVCYCNSTK